MCIFWALKTFFEYQINVNIPPQNESISPSAFMSKPFAKNPFSRNMP